MKMILSSVVGLFVLFMPAAGLAGEISEDITLTLEPTATVVTLGGSVDLSVDVTNTGNEPIAALVIKIDITDPEQTSSVDPEDWTATLSKPVGTLQPGQTTTIQWRIQPISAGTFSVYTIALASGVDTVAASNVLWVVVEDQRSLNPNGIVPVAIGAPALIGALLVGQTRFSRRNRAARTSSGRHPTL